ncbi:MAG: response regulator [Myxococcales bacterium]|nr:response regulator [Myxococcales bacterium]
MSETGTVLYIDDERQVPAGFEEDLRDAGFRLLHTADPDEALMLVRVEEIDLVLAEVVLSTCNGIALLEEIRSYGGWPAQVPIVVLTKGERSAELYGAALELGVKEFFTKPALKTELIESVQQFAGKVLEPTDVDPSEPSSAPESEAAISGDLAQTPISEALLRLRRDAASGVLTVTHRKDRKAFELRNGSPVAASASGGVEALEEFLARRGRISQEQRRTVKERVGAGKGSSGEILVGLGALSEEKFTAAIREQAEEQLLETFRWTSGAFHYFPDKHLRADVALEIERGQAALMLEGARHWSPHEVVAEALSRSASLYVSTVEELPCELAELDLSSAERVFFEHMYGDRNVQEVLDSGDLDARTLHGLFTAGLLVTLEEPVMLLLDASRVQKAPQPEVVPEVPTLEEPLLDPALDFAEEAQPSTAQLPPPLAASTSFIEPPPLANAAPGPDPEPSPLANTAPGPDPEPTPTPTPTPKPAPEPTPKPALEPLPPPEPVPEPPPLAEPLTPAWNAERALEELTAFCERIRSEDDFGILGIDGDTTDSEVRYAYEELSGSLPSEAAAAELPGLKDLAAQARKQIDKAFDRLRVGSSRKVYAQLRPQVAKSRKKVRARRTPEEAAAAKAARLEDLASRGLDAEAWFRRGDGFLRSRSYEQAVEAYGMAAHLDPKEGEYVARLGYAQSLHQPKDAVVLREALENLAKGIKLSPNREKPYIYLGRVFRDNGAVNRARKMFENAVRIKPDCHEALQELRLLNLRQAKGGKLIDRLKDIFN